MAIAAGLAAASVRTRSVDLTPGTSAFRRLVGGATPSGRVHARGVLTLPGLPRVAPGELRIELDEPAVVRVAIDGGASFDARSDRGGVVVAAIPEAPNPGARIVLAPVPGSPPLRVTRLLVSSAPRVIPPFATSFLLTLFVGGVIALLGAPRLGAASALAAAAMAVLAFTPALLWLTLPETSSLVRLFTPALAFAASATIGRKVRGYGLAVLLLGGLVFGAWVRVYFLASAGSWDTEYWKAWTARSLEAGVTGAYGDADATPPGSFFDQMRGREPLWQTEYKGRPFVVDYPPLAIAFWRVSYAAVDRFTTLGLAEKENVAVKLPAVVGDVLAVALLLFAFRDRPTRALGLAALYWALPVSWLSSAALGFLDGAYAPLAVAGLLAAGHGRAVSSGVLLALAALVKPQAAIMVPAAAVALSAGGARWSRALASGLAVVALALVPFALAGTLAEVVTHVFRVLSQERLSAGFANIWWIVGHVVSAGGVGERVDFARLDALAFPAALVGTGLLALSMLWFCLRLRRAAALAGALCLFAYATLAIGVHENHLHAMFLALAATGLHSGRVRFFALVSSTTYVLGMVALSGIGRFYDLRYLAVERLASWLGELRLALGFDVTLALAAVNTCLFVWCLYALRTAPRPRGVST